MAAHTPIMRHTAIEAPIQGLSLFGLRYVVLLNALSEHIWAERKLERTDRSNPDYMGLSSAADTANVLLLETLAEVIEMKVTEVTTVPLHRMALIVAVLIREGTGSGFRRYAKHRDEFKAYLDFPDKGPVEARIKHMLAATEKRISAMARLSVYSQDDSALNAELKLVAA